MRKLSFILLSFVMLCQLSFAQTDVDFMEQVKRDARVNSHIEKNYTGKIISHLYKGMNQALVGVIFQSDQGDYYHVSIKRPEGIKAFPYLTLNQKVEVTLSGDSKLLEEVLYYTSSLITIQNKLDIRLKGIAHLKSVRTSKGVYARENSSYFIDRPKEEVFHENVAIVKKKKVKGNQWAYIMENEDTILVPYRYDDLLMNRKTVSYLKMLSSTSNGAYFKSPNTYGVLAGVPYSHDRTQRNVRELSLGKLAIILEQGQFDLLNNMTDSRGIFNAVQVKKGDDTLKLFFNPKNGETIQKAINSKQSISAFYKRIDDEKYMMYALVNNAETNFYNNDDNTFVTKNNYADVEQEFKGEITKVEFGRPDNQTDLRNFVINDSIFVSVNQIVALNIQKMVKLGKEVSVRGHFRKDIAGEININGYSVMAATAITLESKTFKQLFYDIKKTL